MSEIRETRLPGVGVRYELALQGGGGLVVVDHQSGRVEILLCEKDDPDACREILRLAREDVKALAEVLARSHVSDEVTRSRLSLEGLTIDWLTVEASSAGSGSTLYDVEHRDDEAAAIVAVIRDDQTIPAPPSTFELRPDDVAVAVGSVRGVDNLARLLRSGG